MEINYSTLFCFRIAVIGPAATGKTAIINRIVNSSFPTLYQPTLDIERFTTLFNLNDFEVKEKTFVMVTLEDMFGINNPLLQTPEELLTSKDQKIQRQKMAEEFKNIMFTSTEKRNKISSESKKAKKVDNRTKPKTQFNTYEKIFNEDPQIERKAFIFVCDCTDSESINNVTGVIEKLHQIEKSNNLFYPKCIMINKIDKITDKEKLRSIMKELDQFKTKFKVDIYRVSALTNTGIIETFKKFVSKIHQQEIDNKQNEGFEELDDEDDKYDKILCGDRMNACSKKVFCGSKIFICGGSNEDEEN